MAGKIWQHLGETIRCRFGSWERGKGYKFFFNKPLGKVLRIGPAGRVLRIVAIVLPDYLGPFGALSSCRCVDSVRLRRVCGWRVGNGNKEYRGGKEQEASSPASAVAGLGRFGRL